MGNKALKVLVFIGCLSFQGIAQSIPIQLMVVDSDGFERVNHPVKLRLTLSNDTSNTIGQYQEVHLTQTNDFGIVSVEIGSGISTTNSKVLGISQFIFSASEPFIKVELDTTQSLNQYYEVGYVPYFYPLISRRAFRADSANYSGLSNSARYSDTAEFAKNFNESYDGDTSASNELQSLGYDPYTNTISISNANSITIATNSKAQVASELLPLEVNQSLFNRWMVADSNFIYGASGTNLLKAPITNPDSITSINVGFNINEISPFDSLVFGYDNTYPTYKLYACDLNGQNLTDKYMGSISDDIVGSWTSISDSLVSIGVYTYNYSKFLYTWDVKNNVLTSQQFPESSIGFSSRFIVGKSSPLVNSQWRIKTHDRFTGNTFVSTSTTSQYGTEDLICIDTTGKLLVTYRVNNLRKFHLDSTSSYFGLGGDGTITSTTQGVHGHVLLKNSEEQMFLLNPYSLIENRPITKIVLEDWSTSHPESSGNYYVIPNYSSFLIYFINIENYWINGAFRSGDFLLTIPYES